LVDVWVGVRDPRQATKVEHDRWSNCWWCAASAVLSGADTFIEIEAWAKEKLDWLRQYLKLEQGIPSHDTYIASMTALVWLLHRPLMAEF
jgi:hypothetical protein